MNSKFVPERHFMNLPEKLSGTSKVVKITGNDYRSGVILADMKELEYALRVYNGEIRHEDKVVRQSRATTNNLRQVAEQDLGGRSVDLIDLYSSVVNKSDFVSRILREAEIGLGGRGSYSRSFDYDALGSSFFKTTVEIKNVQGKYVLELNAAYVGRKPEEELAELLEKQQSLVRSGAGLEMSAVDTWWFNIDLRKLLERFPLSSEGIEVVAKDLGNYGYANKNLSLMYEDVKLNLDVGLNCSTYVEVILKDGRTESRKFINSKDALIMGPAWEAYRRGGEDAKPTNPTLSLNLTYPDGRFGKRPAVTPDEIKFLQKARDYMVQELK